MVVVEVARRVRVPVSDVVVRRVVRSVFGAFESHAKHSDVLLSVAFVGSARMRTLNRTYHGEDRVTDVLAFPNASSFRGAKRRGISHPANPEAWCEISRFARDDDGWNLGEMVICPTYVQLQAKRAGEPFRRELTRVLVHGTLHLLGWDHATSRQAERMFACQESIVQSLRV